MLQKARVTTFTVSELLRGNQQEVNLPTPRLTGIFSSYKKLLTAKFMKFFDSQKTELKLDYFVKPGFPISILHYSDKSCLENIILKIKFHTA